MFIAHDILNPFPAPLGATRFRVSHSSNHAAPLELKKNLSNVSWHTLTVTAMEFLRRFLQHVLPKGFQRVRHYGWLSPASKAKWERILALLDWKPPLTRARSTSIPD